MLHFVSLGCEKRGFVCLNKSLDVQASSNGVLMESYSDCLLRNKKKDEEKQKKEKHL